MIVVETLRDQWARVAELDAEIGTIEQRLEVWHRQNAASRRIAEIPGVGLLSATAAVATMGDPAAFRSGREFAAWLGLVPRHSGTGGAGAHARHLEAWGHLSADPADPWRPLDPRSHEGAVGMATSAGEAPAAKCRRRGDGQQDSAHDLGPAGP